MENDAAQEKNQILDRWYADNLKFLWEQYIKLISLGIGASALTLVFLLQQILFNKEVREIIRQFGFPERIIFLKISIIFAGLSCVCFIVQRWCSQILMERQVYARRIDAERYFKETLGGETVLPTAIETKPFMRFVPPKKLLAILGGLNETSKWVGIFLILFSWISCFVFAWPLLSTLSS